MWQFDGGQLRFKCLCEHAVVVHADHGNIFAYRKPSSCRAFVHIPGAGIVEAEESVRMLGIERFYTDCMDKIRAMREYFAEEGIDPANAIYMGDDIPDLECMREVGIPVCPADAAAEVIEASRYVSEFRGGEGAVRDIVEQVLRARGDWARDSMGVTPSSLVASR